MGEKVRQRTLPPPLKIVHTRHHGGCSRDPLTPNVYRTFGVEHRNHCPHIIAYVKHEFTSREYSGQNNRKGRTSCDVWGPGHPCSMRHGCSSAWMTRKRPGQRTCTLSRMWYWHKTGLCGQHTSLIGAQWHSGSCAERPPRQNSEYWPHRLTV